MSYLIIILLSIYLVARFEACCFFVLAHSGLRIVVMSTFGNNLSRLLSCISDYLGFFSELSCYTRPLLACSLLASC